MKKTLTVNLGGTVYHIDEDAYHLLDNYLINLKHHFSKEVGAEEIVDDIERRISELFSEKLIGGKQVITITDVEEVIARIGKPEQMDNQTEEGSSQDVNDSESYSENGREKAKTSRRLFRNPDDKMLGGVWSGFALFFNIDVTLIRLVMLALLIGGCGALIPVYLFCWILMPEAKTAAEKLSMRGEAVNVENIGKTVTNGFEKMEKGVNECVNSEQSRTQIQKIGDVLMSIVSVLLKIVLVLFVVFCSPILLSLALLFVLLLFAVCVVLFGGAATFIELFPTIPLVFTSEPLLFIIMCISAVVAICIPIGILVWLCIGTLFGWEMSTRPKWTLFLLWIISIASFLISLAMQEGDLTNFLNTYLL